MFKLIVAGGRYFDNPDLMERTLDKLLINIPVQYGKADIEIVSGGQRTWLSKEKRYIGADYYGEEYAKKRGYKLKVFPADWDKHDKAAGPIRNREMAVYVAPDGGLAAFWDGKSRGTKSMINIAIEYSLKIRITKY